MRDELLINIINMLNEYVDQSNISDLRWKLELMLSDYDIEKRQTELAILTEDKNEAILRKYIASKLASGRTERTLRYYKNSLTFFLYMVEYKVVSNLVSYTIFTTSERRNRLL